MLEWKQQQVLASLMKIDKAINPSVNNGWRYTAKTHPIPLFLCLRHPPTHIHPHNKHGSVNPLKPPRLLLKLQWETHLKITFGHICKNCQFFMLFLMPFAWNHHTWIETTNQNQEKCLLECKSPLEQLWRASHAWKDLKLMHNWSTFLLDQLSSKSLARQNCCKTC